MCSQLLNTHRIFNLLAKALIRLRKCAAWSEPLLFPHTTLLEILFRGSYTIGTQKTHIKAVPRFSVNGSAQDKMLLIAYA